MAVTLLCMSLSSVCYCQVHIAVTCMFCQVYVIVKCEMFINFNYIKYLLLSCVSSYVTLKYTLLSCARVNIKGMLLSDGCYSLVVCHCQVFVTVRWILLSLVCFVRCTVLSSVKCSLISFI